MARGNYAKLELRANTTGNSHSGGFRGRVAAQTSVDIKQSTSIDIAEEVVEVRNLPVDVRDQNYKATKDLL